MIRRLLIAAAVVVLLAAGAAVGFVLWTQHEGRDIRGSSTVEFNTTSPAPSPPPPQELAKVPWPLYGYDPQRTSVATFPVRPPYRKLWRWGAGALVEFPPAIGYGRLFVTTNAGRVVAISTRTGKRAWAYDSHRCSAASPALHDGTVFVALLNKPPCNANSGTRQLDGEVIAFSVGLGKIRWRRTIGPSESSPLVANGLVYVGDWRGDVYALSERTGEVRWRYHTGGAVKAGVAVSGDRLYVGSYDGRLYCLNARTGKEIWSAASQPRLGHSGEFYSTPAVAYDRVYLGSTDGKVYSYGATSGKLRWSHHTGGYVYSAPAVWHDLVLIGSYDDYLYAFDAATGGIRWRFRADGPVSGAATVIDGVVYFATLTGGSRVPRGRTYALAAGTGKLLWQFPDGKYTPAVADDHRFYLVGYATIYGMTPRKG